MYLGRLASKFKHRLTNRASRSSFSPRTANLQPCLQLFFYARDCSANGGLFRYRDLATLHYTAANSICIISLAMQDMSRACLLVLLLPFPRTMLRFSPARVVQPALCARDCSAVSKSVLVLLSSLTRTRCAILQLRSPPIEKGGSSALPWPAPLR